MIPLILCLRRSHDPGLVALSALVCVLGVYACFSIGKHAFRSEGAERRLWAVVGVVATGGTAWATHFILLLAYRPGTPAGFDPVLTVVSLLTAIVVIGVGLSVIIHSRKRMHSFLGGVVIGCGVGALHYLGQAGYIVQGVVRWNMGLVAASLLVSIGVAGLAGLATAAPSRHRWLRQTSAPLVLLSVGLMHFSGMAAATIYFDPRRSLPSSAIPAPVLAPVMAGAAACVVLLAITGLRFELAARRRQRVDRERLRQLADMALEGLLICDGEVIETANKSLERLCGLDRAALAGRLASSLLTGVDVLSVAEGEEHEAELLDAAGHRVPVRVLRRPVALGSPNQTVVAVRDQRERLRTEEEREALLVDLRSALDRAEAANVAKSQFLANMSHELRTPLNGVLGMAQALGMGELDPPQRERVELIHQSGRALLAVLNDIIDLSKIEAGDLELERIEFDLEELCRGACATFGDAAARKGLGFDLVLAPEARGVWRGDSVRLRQMIYNLVSNAVKFTAAGSITVEIDRLNDALTLRVHDTGVGIAADQVPRLFAKFYQTDSSTTRRFGGAGLGLAVCRELSQLMGGSISAESIEGRGSTFTVQLPLQYVGPAPQATLLGAEEDGGDGGPALVGGELRILAAEDNPANQLVLRALLQAFDVTPLIVENGLAAVEAWERQEFDMILMDVQMPEMDGVAATRRIRSLEQGSGRGRTPIVAVSANIMTHQVQEYMRAGMDGHVAKPIEIDKLAGALERAFAGPDEAPPLAQAPAA